MLWTSKHRSGVAVNMTVSEWEQRKIHNTSSVVTVKDVVDHTALLKGYVDLK